jgi:integrase
MSTIRKRTWQVGGESRSAWVVDYRDQAGTRRLKTFASKREAEAWAVEALHEVARGVHTPASASITVAVCFQRWIEHCEAEGLEFGTIRQRRQHLRLHVEPFIGREKLSELTAPQLYEFLDRLRSAGRSVAMRRKVLTNLKTAIGHAQSQGRVAQNVARGVRLKSSEQRTSGGPLREAVDYPTKAELHRLIDAAPDRVRALLPRSSPACVSANSGGCRGAMSTSMPQSYTCGSALTRGGASGRRSRRPAIAASRSGRWP